MKQRQRVLSPSAATISILLLAAALAPVMAAAQSDAASAIMGRQSFRVYCATCHGTEGRGDGPVAEHLTVTPADLTQISRRNGGEFPFDDVVKTIDGRETKRSHGSSDMPVWGDAFKLTREEPDDEGVRQKIDELAHFIESIQEP